MTGHTCPTCDRTFDSRRALRIHYGHVHEGNLPNRKCARCGASFYSRHEQKYCSDACRERSVSFEGPENPNYRDAERVGTCNICGSEFEFYPSEKTGKYCSTCVDSKEWREPPTRSGASNPRWTGGKRVYECTECGSDVERYPSSADGDAVLCSEECRARWLSEAFTGTGHPNWRGGDTGAYGPGWSRVRRRALARDGYRCVVCGKSKGEIGRNPDVHHIVPVRWFDNSDDHDLTDAHRLSNVVSLCLDCHRKADFENLSPEELREAAGIADPN